MGCVSRVVTPGRHPELASKRARKERMKMFDRLAAETGIAVELLRFL
jgi:hypothetical protein